MIVFQIVLVPCVVLFLLIGTLVIGSMGVEQSESSAPAAEDVALMDEPNSIWTPESISLARQSHGSKETYLEQVRVIHTEINQMNPHRESLSKLPVYKLSR